MTSHEPERDLGQPRRQGAGALGLDDAALDVADSALPRRHALDDAVSEVASPGIDAEDPHHAESCSIKASSMS